MKKKNEVIEMLNQGGYILVDSIYRTAHVYDADGENGDTCRYDVAERLGHADGFQKIKHEGWHASWTVKKAQEITAEEAAEMLTESLRVFERAGVISNLKVEPLREAKKEAAEAEKTAEEWAEESKRVQEATAAALAPVLVAEEAQEEAQEEAEPEYLNESWPESNEMPGIVYGLEWFDKKNGTMRHTRAVTVGAVRDHVHQIQVRGNIIARAWRFDEKTGKFRDFIPETRQEKTDRENREHCRRIAEAVELYAYGTAHKCPHCGEVRHFDDFHETERENDEGEAVYFCPDCGEEIDLDDLENLTLYDYFADCLDIEYRCGSDREYRSVCVMVACGGPNIYIDTATKQVELYWWTDRAHYPISYDAAAEVDAWAEEYWNCL